jgi:hypothetical protein
MPTIGKDPNFVYLFYPHDGTVTVRRYDMTTASTTTLLQHIQGRVKANVSPDGQWLLLTTEVQGRSALQILRLDGQQLQTLYCTPLEGRIDSVLFSPDQRSLLFSEEVGNNSPLTGSLSLLDVETGKVRTEASWSYTVGVLPYPGLSPLKWANESSVYLAGSHLPAHLLDGPPNLYLLRNISKDVSQQKSNIQLIHAPTAEHDCVVVDVTPDNGQLVGICSASPSRKRHEEAATIELRPLTGKTFHTIYRDPGGIVDVRVLSNSTVLFIQSHLDSPDTLWKMNTDGSGATQLMRSPSKSGDDQPSFPFNRQIWSLVSRDGQYYDIQIGFNRLVIGSTSGGQQITIGTQGDDASLEPVGW